MKKILKKILLGKLHLRFHSRGKNIVFSRNVKILNPKNIIIGNGVSIGQSSILYPICNYKEYKYSPEIRIEDDVYIGGYCQIHSANQIHLMRGVVLSDYVYISDVAHGIDPNLGPIMEQELNSKGPVIIGENSFIGFGASVLPGIIIGKNCIVGARSVVTKSLPDFTMVAGNPARIIRKYSHSERKWVSVE